MINLIPCEIGFTPTPFLDTKIQTYEINLPSAGKKIGFNLLDDEYFTIPYVINTITNSPVGHQLPTQAKKMCGLLLTIKRSLSLLNAHLINPSTIIIYVENPRSILVYA